MVFTALPGITQAGPVPSAPAPVCALDVTFDVSASRVTGLLRITAEGHQELILQTGRLAIKSVQIDGKSLNTPPGDGIMRIPLAGKGIVEISYEGIFRGESESVIKENALFMTGIWYPRLAELCINHLTASFPEGFVAISEAEKIETAAKNGRPTYSFSFPHPVDGLNLVASKNYGIVKDRFNDVEIYAYFFRDDIALAKTYIDFTKKYLKLYEGLIAPYPYRRFSIVENFLPTGYSMPTFTLLGRDVVRLPFIVETSLGHEVLHQWLGNLVYIDFEKGNWAEGLTTYLADHLYEEQKGKGWEYRKQMLIDYQSYVNRENEFPLKDFRGRVDSSSRAIGYGKAAMVFHMLRKSLGDTVFFSSLRDFVTEKRFQRATWDDLRTAFERAAKKDLGWFFKQWVDDTGLPEITLESPGVTYRDYSSEVHFSLVQKPGAYTLSVPVTFHRKSGPTTRSVTVDTVNTPVSVSLEGEPEEAAVDEDYDVARKLTRPEFPPVIARLLGDTKILIVPPLNHKERYSNVISAFAGNGGVEKMPSEITHSDLTSSSLVVLGDDNPVIGRLYGKVAFSNGGFSMTVKGNPWNPEKVVGLISGVSKEEVDAAFGKVSHYGKYTNLGFKEGRNILKKIKDSQKGIVAHLKETTPAIDVSTLKTLPDIIEGIANKRIVYVGELHDRFSHHLVQLQIIRALHEKNKKIAIGMEMFQRPFQKEIDEYIEGRIQEDEFLRRSEYFKRWGFDYNLYKPILDFARAEKIAVIALNVRREIVEKVAKSGIDSLSQEEKREIPQDMDYSDSAYRKRLEEVFKAHVGTAEKSFDFFYESQILWDETMSLSIDEFFRRHRDYEKDGQMVVVAGGGHVSFGAGIPKRTFRRNSYSYSIILCDGDVSKDSADYIVFPKPVEAPTSGKLMVLLNDEHGKITISGFPSGSVSEKAGLKIGDWILTLDAARVRTIDDVKIHLLNKKKGDAVRVRVIRKRVLFGDKEMEFDVTLN